MKNEQVLLNWCVPGGIDNRAFHHADCVSVGLGLLRDDDLCGASSTYSAALKVMMCAGHPTTIHETITAAFMPVIVERRGAVYDAGFETFAGDDCEPIGRSVRSRCYLSAQPLSDFERRTSVTPVGGQ
jgi:hypothetical protein